MNREKKEEEIVSSPWWRIFGYSQHLLKLSHVQNSVICLLA